MSVRHTTSMHDNDSHMMARDNVKNVKKQEVLHICASRQVAVVVVMLALLLLLALC